jgi:uncharacterized protein YbjT (DUF2867 family)
MNLTILGATGATGTILVERALAAGHHVTALARNPQKLTTTHPNLRAIAGDATDGAAVALALEGADAVISALGATKGALMADATRAIVAGANRHNIKRVVVLSSFAVQRERLGGVAKLMTGLMMGAMIRDKAAGEDLLRASGLDWTIVYATLLGSGPATGATVVPDGATLGMSQKISRADVAAFLLDTATSDRYRRASVTITGGK